MLIGHPRERIDSMAPRIGVTPRKIYWNDDFGARDTVNSPSPLYNFRTSFLFHESS